MSVADPLARRPDHVVRAVLALGANLGDREATLRSALAALDATEGVHVVTVSPVVETAPVGPRQPDYLNAVALVDTTLAPLELLAACQAVEAAHGRRRDVRWGPRTLDVDLVDVGGLVASGPTLDLPHPRAHERAFVLVPWFAVEPQAVLPVPGGPARVFEVLAALDPAAPGGPDGVRPRPDVVLGVVR